MTGRVVGDDCMLFGEILVVCPEYLLQGTGRAASRFAGGTPATMNLPMNRKLANFTEAVETFDAVCRKVPSHAWDNDSPCEGWTARDVVAHQCAVLDALAKIARTGEWARPAKPAPPDDPLLRWERTRQALLASLLQPGVMERQDKYWFGRMDMATFVSYVQWDPLTHAWDLGIATGVAVDLPAKLCEISYELIGGRADWFRKTGRIGQAVPVAGDASIVERYLAMVGRDPGLSRQYPG